MSRGKIIHVLSFMQFCHGFIFLDAAATGQDEVCGTLSRSVHGIMLRLGSTHSVSSRRNTESLFYSTSGPQLHV